MASVGRHLDRAYRKFQPRFRYTRTEYSLHNADAGHNSPNMAEIAFWKSLFGFSRKSRSHPHVARIQTNIARKVYRARVKTDGATLNLSSRKREAGFSDSSLWRYLKNGCPQRKNDRNPTGGSLSGFCCLLCLFVCPALYIVCNYTSVDVATRRSICFINNTERGQWGSRTTGEYRHVVSIRWGFR